MSIQHAPKIIPTSPVAESWELALRSGAPDTPDSYPIWKLGQQCAYQSPPNAIYLVPHAYCCTFKLGADKDRFVPASPWDLLAMARWNPCLHHNIGLDHLVLQSEHLFSQCGQGVHMYVRWDKLVRRTASTCLPGDQQVFEAFKVKL